MVVHTFNPSTLKSGAGRSPSLRPIWYTERVTAESDLGSEDNH